MTYDKLLEEADKLNLFVVENAKFRSRACGLINNDVIGINKNVRSYTKRSCILAEEIGHYKTTVGNIIDQSSTANRKQERSARMWAYNQMIGLQGIISCYQAGCNNLFEMADHLEVTEQFLSDALREYHSKYGEYAQVDNYIIYFVPTLAVFQIL